MAWPGNRHCASCIGTLSFPIDTPHSRSRRPADLFIDKNNAAFIDATTAEKLEGPHMGSMPIPLH